MVATIMVSLSWLTLPLPPDWPESLEQPAPRPTIMLPSSKPPSSLFMVFFIENVLRFLWGKLPPDSLSIIAIPLSMGNYPAQYINIFLLFPLLFFIILQIYSQFSLFLFVHIFMYFAIYLTI